VNFDNGHTLSRSSLRRPVATLSLGRGMPNAAGGNGLLTVAMSEA
jgi:hypothetical protein